MNHLGDPTIFWLLRLLLFAVLFICGFSVSKTQKKSVAFYLWVAIIAFALVEGLRWMRGTDYENYYYIFKTGDCDKDEMMRAIINNNNKELNAVRRAFEALQLAA